MSYRRLFFLALLAGLPTMTWAQFTTFIPPRTKSADSVKAVVVAQQQARTDSVMRIKLTDMKAWVDSAAGSVAPPIAADPTATRRRDDRRRFLRLPCAILRRSRAPRPTRHSTSSRRSSTRHGQRSPDARAASDRLRWQSAPSCSPGTQLGRDRA